MTIDGHISQRDSRVKIETYASYYWKRELGETPEAIYEDLLLLFLL